MNHPWYLEKVNEPYLVPFVQANEPLSLCRQQLGFPELRQTSNQYTHIDLQDEEAVAFKKDMSQSKLKMRVHIC